MKKALKILRKVCFWIFFIGLFLITTITVILYVYEDEIKQYAVDELNEHLTTPVEVEDIELTFFHSFPSASIEFKKVFIADAFPEAESDDTLFHAKSMFFNFNVMDIYSGNYKVNRISIHEGGLHLKTMADGQSNFNILKPDDDEDDSEDKFEFLLELLELEDMDFRYKNLASQQFYDLNIASALLQGNFTDNEYNLVSEADLHVNRLKSNSFTLVKDKSASLDLELGVNTLAESYTFNKGDLMIEDMPFHVTGVIDSAAIDLNLSGNDIELHDLANSMVDESLEDVKIYEGTGIVNFVSHIHGPISSQLMPAIEAKFDIAGGTITEPESSITLSNVTFNGEYKNEQEGRQEELTLTDVSMNLLDGHFTGSASVVDFAQPILTTSMAGNLNLRRFHQFFNFNSVEKLAGNVNFNFNAKMQFFDPEFSKEKFNVIHSDGVFNLNQVQYKGAGDPIFYKSISGELVLNNNDAAANQLLIKTNNSDLTLNGAMKNLIPFIEGSGSLGLIASIESQNFDLDEFLPKSNNATEDGPLEVFELPANLNLNVDLDVKNFKWEHHTFQNVGAKVLMANREVKMNNLHMNMLEGRVNGNLVFKNLLDQGNVIDGQLSFNQVNIHTLFKDWDNFDQKSITHNHLSGRTSGTIDLLLAFNPYFSLIEEKLYAKCNFKVVNGELNNLETMKSITDYMRSNKGLKLMLNKHIDKFEDKLLHLKFSDLENEITIQDRKITIPRMKIRTNALDVELFGWHDFDNQVEYHFSFRFRELKEQVTENEFGIIEDDGLGLVVYLTMTGDLEDPEFAMDGNERREQIKQHFVNDKKDIKSMLKTDLGFFKKDSTVQKIERTNRNEVQFIIYDGEQEESKDSVVTEEKKNKKHTLKLFEKWKEEAKQNKGKIDYEEDK